MKILIYNENDPRYAKVAPYVLQVGDFIHRLDEDTMIDMLIQIHLALEGNEDGEETPYNDHD